VGGWIGPKKKVFGEQATDDRQSDLLFVVVRMAFPDSFREKGAASIGQESSGLETLFRFHTPKELDLDSLSFRTRVKRTHKLPFPLGFGARIRKTHGAHGRT